MDKKRGPVSYSTYQEAKNRITELEAHITTDNSAVIAALEKRVGELDKELARAKSALLREWGEKASLSHGLTVSAELASGKYEREIAKGQGE